MCLLVSSLPLPQPRVRSSEAERVQVVVEKELNQVYNRGLLRVLKTKLEQIGIPVAGAQQIPSAAPLREGLIRTVVSVRGLHKVQFPTPWVFSLPFSCLLPLFPFPAELMVGHEVNPSPPQPSPLCLSAPQTLQSGLHHTCFVHASTQAADSSWREVTQPCR